MTMMAAVSTQLAAHRRYTVKDVAAILNINHEYFWQCLRAALDDQLRRRRKIPRTTIETLPLKNWKKQGRKWVISEADLISQLN